MNNNKIYYGFGEEYLKNWGLNEALREVYQNFLDYGKYDETYITHGNNIKVTLSNDWIPKGLDFLRIGNSKKDNIDAIGKHGEGLKMAFLIFLRMAISSKIITQKHEIIPNFYIDTEIGECFCLEYKEHNLEVNRFSIEFECPEKDYFDFVNNIIKKEDIIFTDNYWGDIVNKDKGNIYSGGLFIINLENISKAYNIKPKHMPLDRDRSVPRAFDVSYTSSKINEAYGKWNSKDLHYSDTVYIDKVPEEVKREFKPIFVGNSIEFVSKNDKGKNVILKNDNIKSILKKDSFFTSIIKSMKLYIAKKLGLYDMLLEFKQKHIHEYDAIMDFDLILERVFETENKKEQEKEEVPF